jgi:Mn-containing catalase
MKILGMGHGIYNHGNLISDLLDNLVLESTGVLQKTRIYKMSSNKTFRETLAFLIVRDNAHQNAFAKALETLGVVGKNYFQCQIMILISTLSVENMWIWASIMHNLTFCWIKHVSENFPRSITKS